MAQNAGPNVRSSSTTKVTTVMAHHQAVRNQCRTRKALGGPTSSVSGTAGRYRHGGGRRHMLGHRHNGPLSGSSSASLQVATVSAMEASGMSSRVSAELTQLRIEVVGAVGVGPTSLAAFDSALLACGVANFNLVRLSSVIPPRTRIDAREPGVVDLSESSAPGISGGWGERLYAVWAFESAERLGEEAWAGVAWVQDPSDGRGLFVEHEGRSESTVRQELGASLDAMCRARSLTHLEQRSVVVGTVCEGEPVGALVIAPYSVEPW